MDNEIIDEVIKRGEVNIAWLEMFCLYCYLSYQCHPLAHKTLFYVNNNIPFLGTLFYLNKVQYQDMSFHVRGRKSTL